MMAAISDSVLIEVCVDSVQSAVAAVQGGADRLEICGNLGLGGGTTPSIGLFRSIQRAVPNASLMVMIRPRVGDFFYSKEDVGVMLEDIRMFKNFGHVRGFVVGALTKDGRVDVERMRLFVDEILPLEVCFHRAFDMTRDPLQALSDIIDIGGVARILTSGHQPKAPDGVNTLEKLFARRKEIVGDAVWGLTIMPGSGINENTLPVLMSQLLPLGLREVHLSGGKWIPGDMSFKRAGMAMGVDQETEWKIWRTQKDEIRKVREVARNMWLQYSSSKSPVT
ncbi:Copper homeostasis protein cutC-like protein [Psilocybe cubensis]|uniref:Copper homeostasis protein cutC homolog n=2 Tax=Psilocybe cubensis TaxID=181762 RepID=A0A8H7YA82_PSICU|nr:Copper homeostasis protein cutC-like protein [Psilocybe cubensis]KAH9486299.1 Copper homeostasis protein cutC-like protein [Psilocybe cubensis]